MKKFLIAAGIAAANLGAAHARPVEVDRNAIWSIVADADANACIAEAIYTGRDSILRIGVTAGNEWRLSLYSPSFIPMATGYTYTFEMATDQGNYGVVAVTALNAKTIVTPPMSRADVMSLAKAQRIALGNFGTYDMTGSRDAIVKLIKCRDALVRIQQKELEQSKAAPIPQPKRHAPIEPVDQRKRSSEDTIEL